ncbi:hypothetical protein XA68_13688 [Ophiocordyceps unilateralis]|uniref:Uncharacterized protein n=1 Tax=Ophiocordyceps unilateralis TaxID=268505 RepID=A0A2A9PC82_OPHUN|nr:hypothetical protein XA68_13688 [Ophiocordyceps unilateralis]
MESDIKQDKAQSAQNPSSQTVSVPENTPVDDLLMEKKRYPGAESWAPDEERLFAILFSRQERPLLPPHWDIDFRDIPMAPSIFGLTPTHRPIIFAHSPKEFQATTALIRLIDLTKNVRTAIQTGKRAKASWHMKKTIERYVSWAAEDGGYLNLDYVPNIVVDVVDDGLDEDRIIGHVERRMRALARLQRQFLRVDRDVDFWDVDHQRALHPGLSVSALLVEKHMPGLGEEDDDGTADYKRLRKATKIKREPTQTRRDDKTGRLRDEKPVTESNDYDALGERHLHRQTTLGPPEPSCLSPPPARRLRPLHPANLGPPSHRRLGQGRSVWNALTVAIAVCLARDELMARADDFDPSAVVEESDPDA